jgi:hypothetical protein
MPAIRGAIAWSSPSQPVLIQLDVPLPGTTNAFDVAFIRGYLGLRRSERRDSGRVNGRPNVLASHISDNAFTRTLTRRSVGNRL